MKKSSTTRPGSPARFLVLLLLLALFVFALAGCTRDRPAPEQVTPTPSAAVESTPVPLGAPPAQAGSGEPEVELTDPSASGDLTGTVGAGSSEPTIQDYVVQSGDTLGTIAEQFSVPIARLREINLLQNDLIQVGQILQVPMLPPTPVPTPEPFVHVVKAGETLGTIAQLYGVDWSELTLVNQLEDANALQAGMELTIPGYSPEAAAEGDAAGDAESAPASINGNAVHKVRAGETLSQIAQVYGVTTAQIVAANNLSSRNIINPGQLLVIPGVSPDDAERARSVRHTVAMGESLSQIAKQYGVQVNAIVKANGLVNPDSVYVGQQLVIPVNEE